jgi:Bacterial aa3 type cytochrome c oxidase subunit IV
MAQASQAPTEARDFVDHEQTYEGFLRLTAVGTVWVLTHVVALAIGGVAGHWFLAGFFVVVSTIAAALGLAIRGLDWRPVTVVLVVMLATLLMTTH